MPTCRTGTPLRILLLSLALVLTTACQLRLDVAVDVNRNGGGTLAVTVGADAELQDAAAEAGVDPLETLVQTGRGLGGDGWRVVRGSQGGVQTVTLRREFADAAEFNIVAEQLAQALAADEVVLLQPLTMDVTAKTIAIEGAAGAQPRAAVRDYGLTRRGAVQLVSQEQALDYTVTLTLPGDIVSTTASDAAASPLVWQVPVGEQVVIAAESTRPGPPILRAALGALGGAVVAGLLLWVWSRRRRPRHGR